MKQFALLIFFVAATYFATAQYFQTGQDPASIRWRQINTENFQLIFPDYYEQKAQKLANVLEQVYLKGGKTLNHSPKKISIILHTQTVNSNGLVAYAPKRVEFYTIPHQDIYSQDWLNQLAIHEFRHVVQIDKVNSEIPRLIRWLLGEQGTALTFGANLPWWFIEGDAVVSETALTKTGRGRVPSFLMEHKALALEKGNYKYDKAYNGSFKDYVPDHYQLGYYLVGKAREKYGYELWSDVLEGVGKKSLSLTPFNSILKKKTGLNKVRLYDTIFSDLKKEWISEDEKWNSNAFQVVTPPERKYTSYQYNHWLNDTIILSYRTALNRTPSFVTVTQKGEVKSIYKPGTIFDESINFMGEWIVWSERIPNPRWQHSGKSIIRLFNSETKEKISIKTEFTASAPALSENKSKVIVVESNFSNDYYLTVYRVADGKIINRFSSENNNYFFSPVWLNDTEVAAVALFPEGKRLVKIDLENNSLEIIYSHDLGEIKNLREVNGTLYFVASRFGKNSLFKIDSETKEVVQIFEGRFGIESPAFSKSTGQILLSDYTSDGFRLITLNPELKAKKRVTDSDSTEYYPLAENLAKQEEGVVNLTEIDTIKYLSGDYKKAGHLINFHSWAPVSIDFDNYEIMPGVSILSQNKLGSAFLDLGYKWDVTGRTGNIYGKFTYKGLFPVFDIEASTGKNSSIQAVIEQNVNAAGQVISMDTIYNRYTWKTSELGIDVRVPLDFSRRQFSRFLQPEIKYDFSLYQHDNSTPDNVFEGNFQSFSYRLYYQQLLRRSNQDVFPNFGFIGDAIFRHSPLGDADLGSLKLGQTWIYLPGIIPNHGIRLYAGGQKKNSVGSVGFADLIKFPRGWGKISTNQMLSFGVDYKLPVFYPEWSLGGLIYIQRLNASLFADYASLNANLYKNGKVTGTFDTEISSAGIELTGDTNFLRFYAPVQIGFRSSYLPKLNSVNFDFLVSIDFTSL